MPPLSPGRGVLADGIGGLESGLAGGLGAFAPGFGRRLAARYALSVLTLHSIPCSRRNVANCSYVTPLARASLSFGLIRAMKAFSPDISS